MFPPAFIATTDRAASIWHAFHLTRYFSRTAKRDDRETRAGFSALRVSHPTIRFLLHHEPRRRRDAIPATGIVSAANAGDRGRSALARSGHSVA
jgi:hypothetical protein